MPDGIHGAASPGPPAGIFGGVEIPDTANTGSKLMGTSGVNGSLEFTRSDNLAFSPDIAAAKPVRELFTKPKVDLPKAYVQEHTQAADEASYPPLLSRDTEKAIQGTTAPQYQRRIEANPDALNDNYNFSGSSALSASQASENNRAREPCLTSI